MRVRDLFCVDALTRSQKVQAEHCDARLRPPTETRCRLGQCPRWVKEAWSEASWQDYCYSMPNQSTCFTVGTVQYRLFHLGYYFHLTFVNSTR